MQGLAYVVPDQDDVQALADSAASGADELLARIAHPVAQHVLPHVGWDGAFAGMAS